MYANVLVPVDLEHKDQAGEMIRTAIDISGAGAKLTLLFVLPEIPATVGLQMPAGSAEKARAHAETQLLEIAKAHDAPQATSIVTAIGRPHHKILEMAEHDGIDLCQVKQNHRDKVDRICPT